MTSPPNAPRCSAVPPLASAEVEDNREASLSVKEHIDTTISLTWPGRRTIGTLASLHGSEGTVNALSGPDAGIFLTLTVEGDKAEEAIAIDISCRGNGLTDGPAAENRKVC